MKRKALKSFIIESPMGTATYTHEELQQALKKLTTYSCGE